VITQHEESFLVQQLSDVSHYSTLSPTCLSLVYTPELVVISIKQNIYRLVLLDRQLDILQVCQSCFPSRRSSYIQLRAADDTLPKLDHRTSFVSTARHQTDIVRGKQADDNTAQVVLDLLRMAVVHL
jgi:hypothetical protein